MADKAAEVICTPAKTGKVRNVKAWNNRMPPGPATLIVTATVEVPHSGIEPELRVRVPAGFNPAILMLDVYFCETPGPSLPAVEEKEVRFEQPASSTHTEVTVFCGPESMASAPITDAH